VTEALAKTAFHTDVFDDTVPASLIVDLVPIPWRIDDVQLQPDPVLDDDVRLRVYFGR
jgi:hypothetical protein